MILVVEQARTVVVGKDFEFNAEFPTVPEYRAVVVGDAGGPEIRIEMLLEVKAHPLLIVFLVDHIAAPGCEVPPARAGGGLQNCADIARFGQFIGRHQAADPSSQDGNPLPTSRSN